MLGLGPAEDGASDGWGKVVSIVVGSFLHPPLSFSSFVLPLLLLPFRFLYEGAVEELGPAQSFFGVFVEEALEKGFELPSDCFGVDDWVLADVVDKGD